MLLAKTWMQLFAACRRSQTRRDRCHAILGLQLLTSTHLQDALKASQPPPGQVTRKPEVMDDFLRNFFVKMGLGRTSEAFESEWYELKAMGKLEGNLLVPDIYQRNADLEEEIASLRRELNGARSIASQVRVWGVRTLRRLGLGLSGVGLGVRAGGVRMRSIASQVIPLSPEPKP